MSFWGEKFASGVSQIDNREIYEWAAQEGSLPSAYAVPGPLDFSMAPMIRAPLEALRKPHVRKVTCMAGIQCLKTLIGELWIIWTVPNCPGPAQWLQQTNEDAKEHAQERFIALIHSFPCVKKYFTDNRHDKTTAFFRFINMTLRMEGCGTGNVQRKSIRHQMRSEIHLAEHWVPGRLKEADSRLTQFVHNSKTYTESQAGYDAELMLDDMHATFLEGSQDHWNFRCLACDKAQPFYWTFHRQDGTRAAMRWEDSERTRRATGEWRWNELVQTIRYECIYCGHQHADDPLTRRRMTNAGLFVAGNPDAPADSESFAWNQLAMPNLPWFETRQGGVKNFLLAWEQAKRGYDKPLREFFQKVVNEPYHPAKHSAIERLNTVEINTQAAEVLEYQGIKFPFRILGVDVQADHFWLCVECFSPRGDSVVVHASKVLTWDEVEQTRAAWKVPPHCVCVDQSHRGSEVLVECALHGEQVTVKNRKNWSCWIAMRGSDSVDFASSGPDSRRQPRLVYSPAIGDPCQGLQLSDARRGLLKGRLVWIITWSNPSVKDAIIARRDGRAKGVKIFTMRGDWNDEFARQMHSQRKVNVTGKYGGAKWKWERFRDDHIFDCRCMILTKAFMLGLMAGAVEEKKEVDESPEK